MDAYKEAKAEDTLRTAAKFAETLQYFSSSSSDPLIYTPEVKRLLPKACSTKSKNGG